MINGLISVPSFPWRENFARNIASALNKFTYRLCTRLRSDKQIFYSIFFSAICVNVIAVKKNIWNRVFNSFIGKPTLIFDWNMTERNYLKFRCSTKRFKISNTKHKKHIENFNRIIVALKLLLFGTFRQIKLPKLF